MLQFDVQLHKLSPNFDAKVKETLPNFNTASEGQNKSLQVLRELNVDSISASLIQHLA